MPYPRSFLRLVASGTLYAQEEFSFSMSLIPDAENGNGTPVPAAVPQDIREAFEVFWTGGYTNAAAKLTTLKLNLIGTDGRYVSDGNTVLHDYGMPGIAGTASSYRHPAQIALAVTLRTARSRGRAHAGRFYLPAPNVSIGDDGRVPAGEVQNQLTQVATLLNTINASLPGWRIGVASDLGEGTFEEVTGITIGRVLDTIRSRRASLDEAYPTPVALTA